MVGNFVEGADLIGGLRTLAPDPHGIEEAAGNDLDVLVVKIGGSVELFGLLLRILGGRGDFIEALLQLFVLGLGRGSLGIGFGGGGGSGGGFIRCTLCGLAGLLVAGRRRGLGGLERIDFSLLRLHLLLLRLDLLPQALDGLAGLATLFFLPDFCRMMFLALLDRAFVFRRRSRCQAHTR